jgi:hypothetical protein
MLCRNFLLGSTPSRTRTGDLLRERQKKSWIVPCVLLANAAAWMI